MADDLNQMGIRFGKLALAVQADINAHVVEVATRVMYELVQRTPVDVGTARSNWQLTLGSPGPRVVAAYRPFQSRWKPIPAANYYDRGGSRAETGNLRAVTTLAGRFLRIRKPDQTIYISNNLPYIERLADGWSRQSYAGEIFLGIQAGFAAAESTLRFRSVERVF